MIPQRNNSINKSEKAKTVTTRMTAVKPSFAGIVLAFLAVMATMTAPTTMAFPMKKGLITKKATTTQLYESKTSVPANEYDGKNYDDYRLHHPSNLDVPSSSEYHKHLHKRNRELNEGIGKRFVAHASNMHHSSNNANANKSTPNNKVPIYNQPNGKVIGYLTEGQVVRTIGPRDGPWIRHDGGGWTLSVSDGVRYLQPVNE
eukprot:CAMPEP_0119545690 /NCGR_PEP_ID=MMETSP1352-20130426/368_1 /TAXON_ID=265584 /ORGANISM="Stauroneis constricta, Strain CCMP1120" /LENGTH=201 /DNA_ID=CAMNT_0007590271 /DNA_START=189 /DNA_END=794 /DNA_ORIENTATION=+